ncbi:hypothetical protein NPJ82_17570 (plasmid) [Sphingomonas sp. NY01]|uniref:DUF6894 family protein n=1 Tax=Sphingomonas sp. NY01 TaxID=2968057 RepID=UPI00315CD6C4
MLPPGMGAAHNRDDPDQAWERRAGTFDYRSMRLYLLALFDQSGRIVDHRRLQAASVSLALAHANRRLCSLLKRAGRSRIDPHGRMDVLDENGMPVARVYCRDALHSMS